MALRHLEPEHAAVERQFEGDARLMLHRIADPPAWLRTGWPRGIETPPDLFDQFIALARRRGYSFVSLDALHDRLRSGSAFGRCLAVTFDDGYTDVYTRAYPVLTSGSSSESARTRRGRRSPSTAARCPLGASHQEAPRPRLPIADGVEDVAHVHGVAARGGQAPGQT